jgi:hypothetical protein
VAALKGSGVVTAYSFEKEFAAPRGMCRQRELKTPDPEQVALAEE